MATRLDSVHRFKVDEYHRMGELGILPERGVELINGRIMFAGGRSWRFTVDDYYQLAQAGILTESDRTELIEGEIVDMSPTGSRHAGHLKRLVAALSRRIADTAVRSVQDPLHLSTGTEPLPDLMADSSAERDRTEKADLYARSGIAEYWLVDLPQSVVLVHTNPSGAGYLSVETKQRNDSCTPRSLPGLKVSGTDIFG